MVQETKLDPNFIVKDEDALRALFPATHSIAIDKCLNHLDKHAIDFIARSPFLCIGTQSTDGSADVSPRGDPCGFVKVLNDKTLLIPDRPGNNRLDSLSNILSHPVVGLLFIVPGFDETIRVNGTAKISTDPVLLDQLAVNDRTPKVAIVVTVNEVFIHCAKAFRRAKLWDPNQRQDRKSMPSLINIVLDQTTGAPDDLEELRKLDASLEDEYQKTMY